MRLLLPVRLGLHVACVAGPLAEVGHWGVLAWGRVVGYGRACLGGPQESGSAKKQNYNSKLGMGINSLISFFIIKSIRPQAVLARARVVGGACAILEGNHKCQVVPKRVKVQLKVGDGLHLIANSIIFISEMLHILKLLCHGVLARGKDGWGWSSQFKGGTTRIRECQRE